MSDEDDVFEELESTNAEARRRAVRSGDSLPPEPRRRVLVHGMGDPDWRVRREAIETVVKTIDADPTLIEELIDALVQGENVGLRNAALEALARLGDVAAKPLSQRLAVLDGGGRKFILEALGQSESASAVDEIAQFVQDQDPNIAAAAVDALARIGGPIAETHLRALLASDDLYQRLAALDGLVRAGARLAWADLEPAIADRFTRRAAVPLLGRSRGILGTRRVGTKLWIHLAKPDAEIVLADHAPRRPHVEEANCLLEDAVLGEKGVAVTAVAHNPRLVVFAGLPPRADVELRIDGVARKQPTDAQGRVTVRLAKPGRTKLVVVAP